MKYKMLCLDIDGTLTNSNHEITEETKTAIQSLGDDFPVVLVSARMPKGIRFLHEELQMKTPIICFSGALIVQILEDDTYEVLQNKSMKRTVVDKVLAKTKENIIHASVYSANEWFVEDLDEWVEQESQIVKMDPKVLNYKELGERQLPFYKIMCMGNADEIASLEEELNAELGGELTIYRSKPTYLELDSSVSKSGAIQFLHESLGVAREEVIAIGDNYNDIDMIAYAGLGVAMGNAPQEVMDIADEITVSNDENGVAKIIQKYL